jgi:hypothetical protein
MGAAFAGVFWGVLVTGWLEFGTFILGGGAGVRWMRLKKSVLRGTRYLRSGDGVHLLIADWLRHLGGSVMSVCGWRIVEGGCVVGECSAEMFGEMSEGRLFASLRNSLRLAGVTAAGLFQYFALV